MRINNNLSALTAFGQLTRTEGRLTNSLQRLSSGLRINRASDDAAGLAISERMQSQIRSINQSSQNAQHAISLLQTNDGALDTIGTNLQRMRQLAIQAGNDTLTTQDREHLAAEFSQLALDCERIATTTAFNGIKLGEGRHLTIQTGPRSDNVLNIHTPDLDIVADLTHARTRIGNGSILIKAVEAGKDGNLHSVEVVRPDGLNATLTVSVDDNVPSGGKHLTITLATDVNGDLITDRNRVAAVVNEINDHDEAKEHFEAEVCKYLGDDWLHQNEGPKSLQGGITLHHASEAIERIDELLNTINGYRATIGAYQNRLEHTISNLANSSENLTAANSRIRDADIASEMMQFTRHQILIQSGTAMLAQANMKPQSILQLLG